MTCCTTSECAPGSSTSTRTLPFEAQTLDRIVSMNVVEALADPGHFLRECHRVLRPDGLAVVGHTDFDTALFTSTDDALTRELVDRFVALVPGWAQRADGFTGRKLPIAGGRLAVHGPRGALVGRSAPPVRPGLAGLEDRPGHVRRGGR